MIATSDINILFLQAAHRGDATTVKNILTLGIIDIHTKEGGAALYYSILANHFETSLILLEAGASADTIAYNRPLLDFAVVNQDLAHVELLLKYNTSILAHNHLALTHAAEKKLASPVSAQIYEIIMNHYLAKLKADNLKQEVAVNSFGDPMNQNHDFVVVVARYAEELSPWFMAEFPNEKVIIYNKGEDNLSNLPANFEVIKLPNIGLESHTYLHHIINNYHNLSARILFIRADPYDHTLLDLPLIGYKTKAITSCKNTIGQCTVSTLGAESDELKNLNWNSTKWHGIVLQNLTMIDFAKTHINNQLSKNSKLSLQWGQFAIDKTNILCHDLEYHRKILATLNNQHPIEAHYMGRLWDSWANCKIHAQLNSSILQNTPIYILNLDRAEEKWSIVSQAFDKINILYKRFAAIDGYNIRLKTDKTGEEFTGQDIKDQKATIHLNITYNITCNPGDASPTVISVTPSTRVLNAGEFGIFCSYRMLWEEIKKYNHSNAIIFEDDFLPTKKSFVTKLNAFIAALPIDYDMAYLDVWMQSGSVIALKNSNYIGKFSKDSKYYGTWSTILSKKLISKLLATNIYSGSLDEMLLEKTNNENLEVYVSTEKLANIASYELTGFSKNSEISKMGYRADHDVNNILQPQNNLPTKTKFTFYLEGAANTALISMVRNEEDIIFENLVWHFVAGFRKFMIIDNNSTDNTKQIIQKFAKLTENHAKVFIIEDPIFEHIQSRITTAAYNWVRIVWPEVKWVFPVDADEFWFTQKSLTASLKNIPKDIDVINVYAPKYYANADFYNFKEGANFYDKLHYYTNKVLPNDKPLFTKIALRVKNNVNIAQGNHYAHLVDDDKALSSLDGRALGFQMREFPIRSAEQAHKKYSNSLQANLKGKELKILASNTGMHWDAYLKYIEKYGDKAGEVKFNETFISAEEGIDDALPLGLAMEIFYDFI